MALDFSMLGVGNAADTAIVPQEIFRVLPAKAKKYQYLRDVQGEVLTKWFDRRGERDLVLKMNTGSGKTLVGLLLLKSCLNEGITPAVYVAPDPYLVNQVIKEAKALGIATSEDPSSIGVLKGHEIAVINIKKLINGKSVFGAGTETKIPIGAIVIDDAHACLSSAESQFTLNIKSGSTAFTNLYNLFKDDLSTQSYSGVVGIESNDPDVTMLLPYWSWQSKIAEVAKIIYQVQDEQDVMFIWPLIKSNLHLCQCVFTSSVIEISCRCLPIEAIPSFVNAKRRIFMTATLSDDGVLIADFDVDEKSAKDTILPSNANDIGDRLIVVPQELNPDVTDAELKAFFKHLSQYLNVVVIVPSGARAAFWSDVATMTLNAKNIHEGVEQLRHNPKLGLVVLINKYDGIDLPGNACHMLVLDGLPEFRKNIDHIYQIYLSGSEHLLSQRIQRLEQGMGRGIRSNDDYCMVFLMGGSLTSKLYAHNAMAKFTPATRAQLAFSAKVASQLKGKKPSELYEIINMFLKREPNWVTASKSALLSAKHDVDGVISDIIIEQRKAYDCAQMQDYPGAVKVLVDLINKSSDKKVKGWLKQQCAEYANFYDKEEAQKTQKSALNDNKYLIKPLEGIAYSKLNPTNVAQATQLLLAIKKYESNYNNLILEVNEVLELLVFVPGTANKFEGALKKLAFLLGFQGQRPEAETGKGPDVLWEVGYGKYFVIECKNGAVVQTINKHDTNQLSGSMNWFTEKYDNTANAIPIMIHPSTKFEFAATPHKDTRILTELNLTKFKDVIRQFFTGLVSTSPKDIAEVTKLLVSNNLTPDRIVSNFTLPPRP